MATTTTTRTTTKTTFLVSGSTAGQFGYIKSVPGIIRIAEIVLSLIVFICCVATICSVTSQAGWSAFVSFLGFLIALAFLILYVVGIVDANPQIPLQLIELILYAIWTVFYLIAACVLASIAWFPPCRGAAGTGSFFAFVVTILFTIDTVLKFKEWNSRRSMMFQATVHEAETA